MDIREQFEDNYAFLIEKLKRTPGVEVIQDALRLTDGRVNLTIGQAIKLMEVAENMTYTMLTKEIDCGQ